MADLSDVLAGFVAAISAAIYPSSASQPSAIGAPARIFAGWPVPGSLDADMKAGIVDISVFNLRGDRDVTRFTRTWDAPQTPVAPTLTSVAAGNTVTVGGTVTAGNYVTIVAGNQAASYGAGPSDTPSTIAAALAAQFVSPVVVSVAGAVLTFTAGVNVIKARVAAPQPVTQEIQRLQKRIQVTVWANSDALRNAAAKLVVPALMATAALTLADGTTVRLNPVSDMTDDTRERANAYLRDIVYLVEYPTTIRDTQYPVTTIETGIAASHGDGSNSTPQPFNI